MRDRLIELLTDNLPRCGNLPHWDNPLQLSCDEQVERIADHLLANGVIVSPTKKVGEKLYIHQFDNKWIKVVVECEIAKMSEDDFGEYTVILPDGRALTLLAEFFGKTVFLTKEEAERALKEHEKV